MDKDIEDVLNHYYNDSRSDKTQEELDREFEEFKKIMNEYNAEMMRIEEEQTEKDNIILDKIKDLVYFH